MADYLGKPKGYYISYVFEPQIFESIVFNPDALLHLLPEALATFTKDSIRKEVWRYTFNSVRTSLNESMIEATGNRGREIASTIRRFYE